KMTRSRQEPQAEPDRGRNCNRPDGERLGLGPGENDPYGPEKGDTTDQMSCGKSLHGVRTHDRRKQRKA
ncbi:MAG: hypothetical protein ACOCXK_03085, partial [Rhodosalinus sp.]